MRPTTRYSDARYLPPKVRAGLPPRRSGVLQRAPEHCERCGDPLPEAKYHDCGEQLDLFASEET